MDLVGASALVSGAGRGIGRAISLALAGAGLNVTAVSRTGPDLESLAAEAARGPGRVRPWPGDLLDPAVPAAAVAAAVAAQGGLQVLINNAGVGGFAPLAETTDEDWDRILGTNLTAVFRLTRAALPHLTRNGGHVMMISSLAGSNANPNLAAYGASKAALDHLAACLMLEVRQQGVKVTTVAPGSVDTGFAGTARAAAAWMLRPQDVAQTVLDLLRGRPEAHLSRVEMRPLRPQKRQ